MAARFNTKFRKDLFDLHPRAMETLESFPWPGNIRQLENFVQQAVLMSSGPLLLVDHLPQQLRDYRPTPMSPACRSKRRNPGAQSRNRGTQRDPASPGESRLQPFASGECPGN